MTTMYEHMKAKGIDMSWYERGRASLSGETQAPLDDESCSTGSVYLMKANGSLWTLEETRTERVDDNTVIHHAAPYKKVRETGKLIPADTYVCVHTKQTYATYDEALKHRKCKEVA